MFGHRKRLTTNFWSSRALLYEFFAFVLVFLIGLGVLVATPSFAATAPTIINYQGRVLENNQMASTTLAMKLLIYNASSNGVLLYTAAGTTGAPGTISVTPINGFFSVNLGDAGTNSIDPAIFQNNQNVYLEVQIGAETLSPRKQLTAAPYALNSQFLGGVAATSTASTSTYIPISDSNGNFNFNNVTTTKIKLTNGILWGTGTYTGTTGTAPTPLGSPMLLWLPARAAFRAGNINAGVGSKWADSNIGNYSVAFGDNNQASGNNSLAAGYTSDATGYSSVALGYQNSASGSGSVALGGNASSVGNYSLALGYTAHTNGDQSVAVGYGAYSGSSASVAIGINAFTYGTRSLAFGNDVVSQGVRSTAFGTSITSTGNYSIAVGLDTGYHDLIADNTFAVVGGNSLFGTTTAPATSYRVYVDSGASSNPGLGVNGYIKASGFITGTTTLDLAETYPVNMACYANGTCPEAGDIVCVSAQGGAQIERCEGEYNQKMIGIISAEPGFTLGGLGDLTNRKVALAGRVPLRVSAKAGVIKVGDHLTSSDIPGVAKKAVRDGQTIAIALDSYDGAGIGYISAFVQVGWSAPELDAVSSDPVDTSSFITHVSDYARALLAGLKELGIIVQQGVVQVIELVADKVTTKQLCVGSTCINENDLKQLLEKNNITSAVPQDTTSTQPESTLPKPDVDNTASTTVDNAPPQIQTTTDILNADQLTAPTDQTSSVL